MNVLRVVRRLRRRCGDSKDAPLGPQADEPEELITKVIEIALRDAKHDTKEELRRAAPKLLRNRRRDRRRFEQRLMRRRQTAFNLYDLCYLIALQIGETINGEGMGDAQKSNDLLFYVLVRLHARSCLVASEIRSLLVSGHAAGAHARWRTLHEIAVIASFIREQGQDAAQRYLDHDVIQRAREAATYNKYCERLGAEPLDEIFVDQLQELARERTNKYGKSFALPYGWAAQALKPYNSDYRPKFDDIEKSTNLDHLRPYYKMASHGIHAEPRFIHFTLGNNHPDELLLSGPSNVGLTDPAHGALISLMQCTATLNVHNPTLETAILAPILFELTEMAGDAFLAEEKQIAREEEEIRKERFKTSTEPKPTQQL
jgi:hypothetical protein